MLGGIGLPVTLAIGFVAGLVWRHTAVDTCFQKRSRGANELGACACLLEQQSDSRAEQPREAR
jgi:hypothetical protein